MAKRQNLLHGALQSEQIDCQNDYHQVWQQERKSIFTIPKEPFHGYVTIEDNGLNYDNKLYFILETQNKCTIPGDPRKKVISCQEYIRQPNLTTITTPY